MLYQRMNSKEFWTVVGGVVGIFGSIYFPQIGLNLTFLGDIFINSLKCLLIPIVVTSVFLAITGQKQQGEGRLFSLSKKTIVYYTLTSGVACCLGLIFAKIFILNEPTLNASNQLSQNFLNGSAVSLESAKNFTWSQFFSDFFPPNIIAALSEGKIVQVIVFTIFFSIAALELKKEHLAALLQLNEAVNEVSIKLIHWVLWLAPVAVYVLISNLLAQSDYSLFVSLGHFFKATFLAAAIHSFLVLPAFLFFLARVNPIEFFWSTKKALLVALTTASSSATLPVSLEVLKKNQKVNKHIAGFVLPLGATLNMDGCALYQSLVVIFLAKLSGVPIEGFQLFLVFIFVMLSAAGSAGIPGGGIAIVGITLEMLGIPLSMMGIYILIDRFWDYPITSINVWGDLIGTKIIDKNEPLQVAAAVDA